LKGCGEVDLLLPVRCPSNRDLLLVPGDTIEILTSIVVFAEVGEPSCCIERHKVCSVELAREVLRDTASQWSTRVDRELEQPHRVIRTLHWHLDKVGAFVLQTEQTNVAQVRSVAPFSQVLGGVETKGQVDCVCKDHNPLLGGRVPDDLGVSELSGVRRNDRVLCVSFEGVSAIHAVSNSLLLQALHTPWVLSKRIDGYDTIVLIGEETRGIVGIDDSGSGEYVSVVVWGPQCNLLILPVVQVGGGL
jgi:hypothetical protein